MKQVDLSFFLGGRRAGTILSGDSGPLLSYDKDYASDRSATPLSSAFGLSSGGGYPSYRVANWLEGLLPDNDDVKRQWRRKFGIKGKSAMALLASPVGLDCPGAVQFCPVGDEEDAMARSGGVDWLSDDELVGLVSSLRDRDTTWHGEGHGSSGRFSLSGAQAKTALVIESGVWGIPGGTRPSTHIVKPAINDVRYPDQALNEHLCLAAARNLGFVDAVRTDVADIGGIQCIVVTRYDRARSADGSVMRIHQEDMCQALGVRPRDKYQSDGGPTPADIAGAIRLRSSRPDRDAGRFLDALMYNWVIVGTDAHAKNYSFLLHGGAVQLAPLYDVASMLPYLDNSAALRKTKLAMKIGRDYRVSKSDRKSAWYKTGEAMGFDGDAAVARAEAVAKQVPAAFDQAARALPTEFGNNKTIGKLLDMIDRRATRCARVSALTKAPSNAPTGRVAGRATQTELREESGLIDVSPGDTKSLPVEKQGGTATNSPTP